MIERRICKNDNCGKPFPAIRSDHFFCSRKCFKRGYYLLHSPELKKKREEDIALGKKPGQKAFICLLCQNKSFRSNTNRKYCVNCRDRYRKGWYQKNKDRINKGRDEQKALRKRYRVASKERSKEPRPPRELRPPPDRTEYYREYFKRNKEKKSEYFKKYYEKIKQKNHEQGTSQKQSGQDLSDKTLDPSTKGTLLSYLRKIKDRFLS